MSRGRWIVVGALIAIVTLVVRDAPAFCGFYVSGADAKLFNDATQVVLMRDGTRTVLSMQNHYAGPPEDFAMVVPVPVVLQKDQAFALVTANLASWTRAGFVGAGASVFLACAGALLPLGLYVLIPRKT